MEDLRFKYKCHYCGKEVRMNTKDIITFIGDRFGTPDGEQLEEFFSGHGIMYNLCPQCALGEGMDVKYFEGWVEEDEPLTI